MRESEADVVPTPPAFDAFAADEGDRDREGGVLSRLRSSFPF